MFVCMFTIQCLRSNSVSRLLFFPSRTNFYLLTFAKMHISFFLFLFYCSCVLLTCVLLLLLHFPFKTVSEFWWSPLVLHHRNNNNSKTQKWWAVQKHPRHTKINTEYSAIGYKSVQCLYNANLKSLCSVSAFVVFGSLSLFFDHVEEKWNNYLEAIQFEW